MLAALLFNDACGICSFFSCALRLVAITGGVVLSHKSPALLSEPAELNL